MSEMALPSLIDTSANKKAENGWETTMIPCSHGPFVVDIFPARTPTPATPILLIHGWGNSGTYWRRTAEVLAQFATVYVPDLPGTGRSQPTSPPQDMFDQVNTLRTLLNHFNLAKVQIVGHSMGSAMGILLADQLPERVSRIVITSMCFFMNAKEAEIYTSIMKVVRLMMRFRFKSMAHIPGFAQMMAGRYFYRIPNDPETLQQGLEDYLSLDFDTAFASAKDATSPEIEVAGARLQMPALLIACRQDQVMPIENVEYSGEVIPDCRVAWIDKCGHLPMVEKPEEYQQLLEEFLETTP
jgi:pimeloyl-ACP methyl ester carboxylesterase